jgi:RNA-directed DNA polymerase
MEELHIEGLATHGDPESCAASREGRGEALTGARAGRAIEPRNCFSGVPTLSIGRKATSPAALCESPGDPARSENQGMYGTFVRENREVPCLPACVVCGRVAGGTPRR